MIHCTTLEILRVLSMMVCVYAPSPWSFLLSVSILMTDYNSNDNIFIWMNSKFVKTSRYFNMACIISIRLMHQP